MRRAMTGIWLWSTVCQPVNYRQSRGRRVSLTVRYKNACFFEFLCEFVEGVEAGCGLIILLNGVGNDRLQSMKQ